MCTPGPPCMQQVYFINLKYVTDMWFGASVYKSILVESVWEISVGLEEDGAGGFICNHSYFK